MVALKVEVYGINADKFIENHADHDARVRFVLEQPGHAVDDVQVTVQSRAAVMGVLNEILLANPLVTDIYCQVLLHHDAQHLLEQHWFQVAVDKSISSQMAVISKQSTYMPVKLAALSDVKLAAVRENPALALDYSSFPLVTTGDQEKGCDTAQLQAQKSLVHVHMAGMSMWQTVENLAELATNDAAINDSGLASSEHSPCVSRYAQSHSPGLFPSPEAAETDRAPVCGSRPSSV